ncbi:MAG: GTP-binding protein [Rikenellaceae bacterium]|nr:GTP-binding protein [Rikenellaceae bacterium]
METSNKTGYLDMELLRFTTAGSVDDGKSTLIGRLLYDSKSIFEDQMEAIESASERAGNGEVNLALLTDGLRAEREQGITIDVAYRYFATPRRKFIIADTPGHIQYTRNMVTGASTADLAIILVDARNGVVEQTVRHSYIASLLDIKHIVVCINKMDLVDFSEMVYDQIRRSYKQMASRLALPDVKFIPISAKLGDNVVTPSDNMPWYIGRTLMEILETTHVEHRSESAFRFPVQYVIRPQSDNFHDFRGYAGRIAGGVVRQGDKVTVLPSGRTSVVTSIFHSDRQLDQASSPQSVSICLVDDIDISRGDILVATDQTQPAVSKDVTMTVCWFNENPLAVGGKYIIRHATRETVGIVKSIGNKIDVNTLGLETGVTYLNMNDIATVTIRTAQPLVFDDYERNRTTGSLIFVDKDTFETCGAGMITLEHKEV